jgi:hypothetical protein
MSGSSDFASVACVHRREKGADVTTRMAGEVADLWARTPDGRRVASRRVTLFVDEPQA